MSDVSCELKSPKLDAKPRAVSVNGVTISRAEISRETQNHAAPTPIAAWKKAARALAIRELLRQEAERLGLVAEPQSDESGRRETPEEAAMRALLDDQVHCPVADSETCARYYTQNRVKFRSSPLYGVRHILIAARGEEERPAARNEALALIKTLSERPELFADLARATSACSSGQTGGHLGQISEGQTVPEFEEALADMALGLHPHPIETRYGFHVTMLDQKIDGHDLPFELVQEQIAAYLNETVRRRALKQYVTILAERANISGIDMLPDAA